MKYARYLKCILKQAGLKIKHLIFILAANVESRKVTDVYISTVPKMYNKTADNSISAFDASQNILIPT